MPTIGENIATLRKARSWSQAEFGDRLRMRQPSVWKLEQATKPNARTLIKVAAALECRIGELFYGVDGYTEPSGADDRYEGTDGTSARSSRQGVRIHGDALQPGGSSVPTPSRAIAGKQSKKPASTGRLATVARLHDLADQITEIAHTLAIRPIPKPRAPMAGGGTRRGGAHRPAPGDSRRKKA